MRKFVTGERQSEVPMWQIGGSMDQKPLNFG